MLDVKECKLEIENIVPFFGHGARTFGDIKIMLFVDKTKNVKCHVKYNTVSQQVLFISIWETGLVRYKSPTLIYSHKVQKTLEEAMLDIKKFIASVSFSDFRY